MGLLTLASSAPSPGELIGMLFSIFAIAATVVVFILSNFDERTKLWKSLGTTWSGIANEIDALHVERMRHDRTYRRRLYESAVFMALSIACLIGAAILFGSGDPKLVIYIAACGVGMEWWATATMARLVTTQFTNTAQSLFVASFLFAILLAIGVSLVVAARLSQIVG